MSSLIVEVSRIDQIAPHPNADKLELAQIKGWQCVVPKSKYKRGDLVTYVPIDSVLPIELSERIGVTKYLSNGRVRCAKLRGEPSFGLIMDRENETWSEGTDVREHYGITKYVPPVKLTAGDAEPEHPLFVGYTDVENMRNFPTIFTDGEEVIATEKIHGTNCRVGVIRESDVSEPIEMAGSKTTRRRKTDEPGGGLYWLPWSIESVRSMLTELGKSHKQVILFGEVFGKVQSLRYGLGGSVAFRAFDLLLDGAYVDFDRFVELCTQFGVETVPIVFRGKFRLETIRAVAEGKSLVPGADNIREGVVVKPVQERRDPKLGRAILKYVSDAYLFGEVSDTNDE